MVADGIYWTWIWPRTICSERNYQSSGSIKCPLFPELSRFHLPWQFTVSPLADAARTRRFSVSNQRWVQFDTFLWSSVHPLSWYGSGAERPKRQLQSVTAIKHTVAIWFCGCPHIAYTFQWHLLRDFCIIYFCRLNCFLEMFLKNLIWTVSFYGSLKNNPRTACRMRSTYIFL